jgi:anti-sigma B factor antagonist
MSDHSSGREDVRLRIDVTAAPESGAVVVAPHGDVDLTTAEVLRAVAVRVIDDGATALVLDLADVAFMDSTGLGVLVVLHHRLRERFVVAAVPPTVLRLLESTRFTSVLHVTDSVTTALAALRS